LRARGLAEYRLGQFEAAQGRLDKLASGPYLWGLRVPAGLVSGMAQYQRGRTEPNRAALAG
jgi:hypothetical protein